MRETGQVADQLEQQVERWELLRRAADDSILDWDLVADRITWNDAVDSRYGPLPAGGQSGFSWLMDRIHPDDRARVAARLQGAIEAGERVVSDEFRIRRSDGSYATVLDRGFVLRDETGRAVRKVESLVDITAQKQAEERQHFLAEVDRVLATELDYAERIATLARVSVPVLADYCVVDLVEADGEVRRVEAAHTDPEKQDLVRRLIQYPPIEFRSAGPSRVVQTGRSILVPHVGEQDVQQSVQHLEHLEIVRQLDPTTYMTVPLTSRGQTLGAISFVRSRSGAPYNADDLALAEDLGKRAGLLLDNSRLYRQAQQAARAREDVLAVVAHELRSPLQAISASVEALHEQVPSELRPQREREYLEFIDQATAQMNRRVNDLLDITRLEAGHLAIRRFREDAASIAEELAGVFEPLARRKALHLQTEVAADLPPIFVDRHRVVQVLDNLIGNAIQATPDSGSITLEVKPVGDSVRFSVTDTGTGIPEEHLANVFERNWTRRRSGQGNAGLGLAIAKAIVEAHGGSIAASSRPGEGSTFTFTVPVALPAAPTAPEPNEPNETFAWLAPAAERGEEPGRGGPNGNNGNAKRRRTWSRQPGPIAEWIHAASSDPTVALLNALRAEITHAVFFGHLRPGDRLPSIRKLAREYGATLHAVAQAYDSLSSEGFVEKRGRSGVYVAPPKTPGADLRSDASRWLADVLSQACEHQVRISYLPELVRRWTSTLRLHCACIDSDEDHRTALCAEVHRQFGLDGAPVPVDRLPPWKAGQPVDLNSLPREIAQADVLVTTTFHAAVVGAIAQALNKPVAVATVKLEVAETVERHLREGPLTVVCTDSAFADRIRALRGGIFRDQIRTVLADDAVAIAALDRSQPVLLTLAAHQRLGPIPLRRLVPHSRSFSPEFERCLAEVIVQLNLEASR